jgi:hypothetical protein
MPLCPLDEARLRDPRRHDSLSIQVPTIIAVKAALACGHERIAFSPFFSRFSAFFVACLPFLLRLLLPLFFADVLMRARAKGLAGALALRGQWSRKYRA